ncbi:MAG: hypothetical protein JSS44_10910 [Proteobacteria bacterium]|nr:hypothetical protein [Pseudomonadota bacterium]
MSDSEPRRALDLSAIPEPFRAQILKRLAKLPDAQREKLLREGSPVIERLLASLSAGARQQQEKREAAPLPAAAADADPGRDVIGGRHPVSVDSQRILDRKPLPTVMQGDSVNHIGWLGLCGAALIAAIGYAMYG